MLVSVLMFGLTTVMSLACQSTRHQVITQRDVTRQNEVIKPSALTTPVYKSYPVTVDCSQSPDKLVMAGKYDLTNKTEFSVANLGPNCKGKVEVELFLIHLGYPVTDNQAVRDLDKLGYRPVPDTRHLLTFGAKYPDKQLEFPIVAPGSNLVDPLGRQYVSYLERLDDPYRWDPPKRVLHMFTQVDPRNLWSENCRFLAMRK